MSWNEIIQVTGRLKETIEIILKLNKSSGDFKMGYFIWQENKPPMIHLRVWIIPSEKTPAISDPLRARSISQTEMSYINSVMEQIKGLEDVHLFKHSWEKTGLKRYQIGVKFSKYLDNKRRKKYV